MLSPADFRSIVFFTGAGMSAESGIPTYRGAGGLWHEYRYEEYACQAAFERHPDKVLDFHYLRREQALSCQPHAGHRVIAALSQSHPGVTVVTQNIDGMHQRAGNERVIEVHGSLWRMRCAEHGVTRDVAAAAYAHTHCPQCGRWLRPDITWFGDYLDEPVWQAAFDAISDCDLFISIGTSGVVYPAARLPELARAHGARMLCINTEVPDNAFLFDEMITRPASLALPQLFPLLVTPKE
ncbi:MAG: NAD-dependent deacylase [Gammaproteobacteria bacterium]|nr:MAG: NAD-dependent deacylase [Gammaproteobacteria bacterium]